jgi:DHA1 family tetracycline resistance protein-like MFS transporter
VAQAVAAPVLGRLADRHGRRRLLLLSVAGSATSLAIMGLAGTLWLLLLARTVAGICGGSIGVAQAFAADVVRPAQRTKAMGQIGAAVGLAFTLGPALGALSAPLGFSTTAYIAAALAAGNWVLAWKTLPATTPVHHGPRPTTRGLLAPWPLLIASFASMAAFVGMETTVAFVAATRFSAGPTFVGILLCLAGLALTLVQGFLVAPAANRWGERRAAIAGTVMMTLGLLAIPVASQPVLVSAVIVLSAGNGVVTATVASMLATTGPPSQRGARMGQGQSAASAARALGPLSAGLLFDVTIWAPYLLGAFLSVAVATAVAAAREPTVSTPATRL